MRLQEGRNTICGIPFYLERLNIGGPQGTITGRNADGQQPFVRMLCEIMRCAFAFHKDHTASLTLKVRQAGKPLPQNDSEVPKRRNLFSTGFTHHMRLCLAMMLPLERFITSTISRGRFQM
jgi:hypothetical protein